MASESDMRWTIMLQCDDGAGDVQTAEVLTIERDVERRSRCWACSTGKRSSCGTETYGRLTGVAVAADGALLVSDDTNGVIYRVAWGG